MDHWTVLTSEQGVVITCRGYDRNHAVQAAVNAFHATAAERKGDFAIIADLAEMTGYETESRRAWQTAFAKYRGRVLVLVLVGARTALIKMCFAAVGAHAGIPVKFVSNWSEVSSCPRPDRTRL